jgi:hypothetical protein
MRITLAFLLTVACSNEAGDGLTLPPPGEDARPEEIGPGRLSTEQFQAYTEVVCRTRVACGMEAEFTACVDGWMTKAGWFRGDLIAGLAWCSSAGTCDTLANCDLGIPEALEIHLTYRSECSAKYASCPGSDSGLCRPRNITFANTDLMDDLVACLDRSCGDYPGCLTSTATQYGFAF